MRSFIKAAAISISGLLFSSFSVFTQETLVLQPGPTDGYSVYVNDYSYNYNAPESETFLSCYWTIGATPGVGRSFMKFDLSALPAGSTILSATLSLYYNQGSNAANAGDNASWLMRVTGPWIPESTYFYNQPATTTAERITLPASLPDVDFPDIDLTPFVEFWAEKPDSNFGFMIRLVSEDEILTCMTLGSAYAAAPLRPRLEIVYTHCENLTRGFTYNVQVPVVQFNDTTTGSVAWLWDFGDGYSALLKDPVHTYEEEGIYDVCLIVTDSCGTDTLCKTITVCNMPVASFDHVSNDSTVTFTDSSAFAGSWFWDFGDGFYSDLRNPVHIYNELGTYNVCLVVGNNCGSDTICDSLLVEPNGIPGGNRNLLFSISPNPASSAFILSYSGPIGGFVRCSLLDISGQELLQREITEKTTTIDISTLPVGIYIVKLVGEKGVSVRKLMKE